MERKDWPRKSTKSTRIEQKITKITKRGKKRGWRMDGMGL
jgi:hypothetical protein